ncbi:sigma-B regulation protein RsbU (phosphoserine phosphatase) [Fibrobacter sp. UWB15]|uniref:SpoIIE family protein phosphatase n=1 Tax=unclassified Fibrobacter TaxID=2634177 RepID=UPI0009121D86|nr:MULTISPECIES: SpoIIE family protein phosphatase [unclassified Fibrobacter]PWJ62852.1 sigma-B regulation protein RsbU (phosphoserine phosphatase) [Fibrobacter sp. UWB6]SHG45570.1 sigma-B regulation protein RsbU (phosphoserine phosphatase) [Fibrobacter sp. UWB8]SMG39740.1 sigma-B regulation protein RsbU (phosphoserine phosphatase) [Fibrobacter sp. UWB15]
MGFNFRGLAFKQSLMILAAITVVFGLIFGIMSYKTQNMLNKMTVENGEETSRANVNYIDKLFNASKLIGEDLSHKLTDHPMTKSDMDDFLLQSLFNARNLVPQVVAVVVAYEPGMGPENTEGEYMRLARFDHVDTKLVSGANYQDKEWYYSVRDGKTSRWQEPFIGEFVPEPIAVYTVPLFKKDKNGEDVLVGVLAVDMSIEFLKEEIGSIPVSNSGYALVTTAKNLAVAYPKELAQGKRNRDIIVREKRGQKLIDFDRKGRDSSGLFIGTVADGEESAIYYTTINSTNWTFMVVWPIQKYLEDQKAMRKLFLLMALGGYGIILVIILLISFRVAKPLKELAMAARKLGRGNFDVAIPKMKGRDEVAEFAWAFSNMLTELKDNIEKQKDMKRIERELDLARNIQLSMLPGEERDENSDDDRHELAPFLLPAKEVGGDFYDFFKIDNDHLCVVIGDVSGKGVAAALFMMVARIILRTMTKNLKSVVDAFNKTNYALAKRNRLNMFVTVWAGIIDLRTGHIDFASAGHNPPAIRHKDGSVEFIPSKAGLVMAAMEGTVYKLQTCEMKKGDTLFLYTDGVTEATDSNNQLFNNDRLIEALKKSGNMNTADTCSFVKKEIDSFVKDAPQFDDITMLAIKFNGSDEPVWERYEKTIDVSGNNKGELKSFVEDILTPMDGAKKMQMQDAWERYEKIVDVIPENQDILTAFVEGILAPMDGSMKSQMQINIAIDEIYSNIVKFSGATEVTLIVEIRKATMMARLTFIDNGKPYDPIKQADPDISLPAEEREIGGLGIFIVKKTMDSVCYRRNGDKNELAITKTL